MNFLPIPGYEQYYEISQSGVVRSCNRAVPWRGVTRNIPARIITPRIDTNGYIAVRLNKNGICKNYCLHKLLALVFIPNAARLPDIDHINRDKLDNRLSNLRWVTTSQNVRNTSIKDRAKSKFYGVTWHKRDKRWQAQIKIGTKNIFLGNFADEQSAALAYDRYLIKNKLNIEPNFTTGGLER